MKRYVFTLLTHTLSLLSASWSYALPPSAYFSRSATTGLAPLSVDFNASLSSDSDGVITSYQWDFGDGTTGSGAIASHGYQNLGTYTVTLTVTDNAGEISTKQATISVVGTAPATIQVGSASGNPGTSVSLNFNFTPSSQVPAAGMNWDLALPSGFGFVSAVEGAASTSAQKQLVTNFSIGRFLVFGFNLTTIGPGNLATATISIPASARPGVYPLSIFAVTVTNPDGMISIPANALDGTIQVLGDTTPPAAPSNLRAQ